MSAFSFPPPPPPPPKASTSAGHQPSPQRDQPDRGSGRGSRGRGQPGGRGRGGQEHYQHSQPLQAGPGQPRNVSPYSNVYPTETSGGYGPSGPQSPRPTPRTGYHSGNAANAASPQRTSAGHKRKLDALRGPPPGKQDKKPAPATSPAVPTFGAPFVPAASPSTNVSFLGQKPSGRSLGLTPGSADPQYLSSDGEDDDREVDEEAEYAELGDKLTFEHNGVVMSLRSQADLLAWKKDRQKNWPTKSRMATKNEERSMVGEERKRLLAGAEALYGRPSRGANAGSNIWTSVGTANHGQMQQTDDRTRANGVHEAETELSKAKRDMAEKAKRLDELRWKVTESEARNRKAREDADKRQHDNQGALPPEDGATRSPSTITNNVGETGEEHKAVRHPTHESGVMNNKSTESPATSSSSSSSEEAEEESDDEPPEELHSKAPSGKAPFNDGRPACRYFRAGGWCRDGDACRFKHDAADQRRQGAHISEVQQRQGHVRQGERPPKLDQGPEKRTIFQRLVEQEEEEDDRLALKVIKYLGGAGFFSAA